MWGARSCLHRGGNRGEADRPVEQRGSPLPWSADDWCETPPPFRGSLLGATTGLFVLMRLHECLTLLGFFSDRVISLVCRTFWHCAISKVDVHHVQGDLHRDSHGQVRSVISQCDISATFQMKNYCHKLFFTISSAFCEFLAIEWLHDKFHIFCT